MAKNPYLPPFARMRQIKKDYPTHRAPMPSPQPVKPEPASVVEAVEQLRASGVRIPGPSPEMVAKIKKVEEDRVFAELMETDRLLKIEEDRTYAELEAAAVQKALVARDEAASLRAEKATKCLMLARHMLGEEATLAEVEVKGLELFEWTDENLDARIKFFEEAPEEEEVDASALFGVVAEPEAPEPEVEGPSLEMTRKELDKLAKKAGVKHPHKLANKQAVLDALNGQD